MENPHLLPCRGPWNLDCSGWLLDEVFGQLELVSSARRPSTGAAEADAATHFQYHYDNMEECESEAGLSESRGYEWTYSGHVDIRGFSRGGYRYTRFYSTILNTGPLLLVTSSPFLCGIEIPIFDITYRPSVSVGQLRRKLCGFS